FVATVVDTFGCSRTQKVNIDVWKDFSMPSHNVKDTGICIGQKVQFNINATDKLISWNPTDFMSSPNSPNPVITPASTTTYTATITDQGNCFPKQIQATIEVNPYPSVDVGPDLILPYNTPFTFTPAYSSDIVSYNWQPSNQLSCSNCPNPSGVANISTQFVLTTTTDKGCVSRNVLRLTLDCSQKNLLMPNAFSPNGDGLNDVYYPLTRGMRAIKKFVVYNRYGQLLHERSNFPPNNKNYGWDGTFNGKRQPVGGYVYFVEGECDLGNTLSDKGTFVITR
nr:gliding motility-associated C-terminal domain-containing protein [Chitinophagaceae bacterium]